MERKMKDIERNDVDISQLFKWKKSFEIGDPSTGESITIHMRVVGDSDINRAKAHGYRKAGELRRLLHEEGSDYRVGMINELTEFESKEMLVTTIIYLRLNAYRSQAFLDVSVPIPNQPKSNSPQVAFEKYQEKVDEYSTLYNEAVENYIKDRVEADSKTLGEKEFEELYKLYEKEIVDRLCLEELTRAFYDRVVFHSCFLDEGFKQPAFKEFEEYENASTQLKETLIDNYRSLELGMDFLKKLQGVTDLQSSGQTVK